MRLGLLSKLFVAGLAAAAAWTYASAHGDVSPQPVDTTGLAPLSKDWLEENPYRDNDLAIKIGASGYNQNGARCHGIAVISGGLARSIHHGDT
jgi:hypothetical protein